MFIVASFSVVNGLRTSMDTLKDNFVPEYSLVTLPGESGPELFSNAMLSSVSAKTAFGLFVNVVAYPSMQEVTVFAVDDPHDVLPESIAAFGNDVLVGQDLQLSGHIVLGQTNVTVVGKFSSSLFSSDWILGSVDLLDGLTGRVGMCNFAIVKGLSELESGELRSDGFSVQAALGIVDFLDSSVREVESDASWALLPSAFVIAVLAYSFMGSETADRRHDIGILKTVGAGRWRILSYLLVNAAAISAWGGLLGLGLGIVLSYAVSTAASAMFTSVFVMRASEMLLLSSFAATVGAGVMGAVLPSIRMTLSSPVKDLREVTPFS
ncbi:MAG: FtsX-like permease family protein [Thermoplasmata archaeon]